MYAADFRHDDIAVRLSCMGASLMRKAYTGKTALYLARSDELRNRMLIALSLKWVIKLVLINYVIYLL